METQTAIKEPFRSQLAYMHVERSIPHLFMYSRLQGRSRATEYYWSGNVKHTPKYVPTPAQTRLARLVSVSLARY